MSVAVALILTITAYAPMAGGINGGACVGRPWQNCKVQRGDAACGWPLRRGYVVELQGAAATRAVSLGLPTVYVCRDGGGSRVQLDLAIVSADRYADVALAFAWGRQRGAQVRAWPSVGAYAQERAQVRRHETALGGAQ